MKKYYLTIVRKDGTEKQVYVLIPEETAVLLDQCDEKIRLEYLKEEYKAFLRERAETRRHISLEQSVENGHDFESKEMSALEYVLISEERLELLRAIEKLPVRQRQAIQFYVFEKKEIEQVLGEKEADAFCAHYGITAQGNFEGKNILNLLTR